MFISRDVLYCQYFEKKNSCSPLEIQDFEENFSFSSRLNEILQTDSLLESQKFERQTQFLLSIPPSISLLILVRNYIFATWLDFDRQCFAERESILKRQFCVVEQYSNFSQQKHFGDSILQHTIFILELDVSTSLCGGDNFSFLGQKKNKTEIGM